MYHSYGKWRFRPLGDRFDSKKRRGVTASEIDAFLRSYKGSDEQKFRALQAHLKCGTNCGSCLAQVKRVVRSNALLVAS